MHKLADMALWQGRSDSERERDSFRLHQWIQNIEDFEAGEGAVIIGFACDEGVRRNRGRVGASTGPSAIRDALAGMTCHMNSPFYDAGDVLCCDSDLPKAQSILEQKISELLANRLKTVVLGGGHETAIASYRAAQHHISCFYPGSVLGIINFDAHFDLRNHTEGPSSGTPFSQAAEDCFLNNRKFSYTCYGISRGSNTRTLFNRANDLNVQYLLDTELAFGQYEKFVISIQNLINSCDFIYLTIDLDVLPAGVAPGVSAPAALGIPLNLILHAISMLKSAVHREGVSKLLLADICELNPHLDIDNRTAKVAARLCYDLLTDSI